MYLRQGNADALTTECFPIRCAAVNKHLYILSAVGVVGSQKIERKTWYTLRPYPLVELQQWLYLLRTIRGK